MATFSWAAAADVGIGLVGALGKNAAARATADAENTVRQVNNEVASAQRGLAATVRILNNKRIMEAAGQNLDAMTRQAGRTTDALTRQDFEGSIKGAEQWGAQAARAAGSGLGGAGIEAISRTTSLQIQRRQEQFDSQADDITYEQAQATTRVMSNALLSLEQGPLTARQDFSRSYAPGVASALIGGLLSKRESLQTLLGSMVPGEGPVSQPIPDRTAVGNPIPPAGPPVERADFAFTTPVPDVNIVGVPLQPRGYEQADIRRIDNVTLN